MQRRTFIGGLTMLGVGVVTTIPLIEAQKGKGHTGKTETVRYSVTGFTCITCAVGLETLLKRENGVISARADYPSAVAEVEFAPDIIQEQKLRSLIQEMGFSTHQI